MRESEEGVVLVRWERSDEVAAIRRVNEQAFGRAAEADLVDTLRDRGKAALSPGAGAGAPLRGARW